MLIRRCPGNAEPDESVLTRLIRWSLLVVTRRWRQDLIIVEERDEPLPTVVALFDSFVTLGHGPTDMAAPKVFHHRTFRSHESTSQALLVGSSEFPRGRTYVLLSSYQTTSEKTTVFLRKDMILLAKSCSIARRLSDNSIILRGFCVTHRYRQLFALVP